MPQSQVCPHPCYTIPNTFEGIQKQRKFSKSDFSTDVNSKVGKGTEDLWEAKQKRQRSNHKKKQRISGREKHLNSPLMETKASLWAPPSTLPGAGGHVAMLLCPPGTVALLGSPTCHSSSALWQLITRWGICPRKPPWIFVTGAYIREMDPQGLGSCKLWGMLRDIYALTPACRHRVSGTTRHSAQFQSPSNTERFSMIGRTWRIYQNFHRTRVLVPQSSTFLSKFKVLCGTCEEKLWKERRKGLRSR